MELIAGSFTDNYDNLSEWRLVWFIEYLFVDEQQQQKNAIRTKCTRIGLMCVFGVLTAIWIVKYLGWYDRVCALKRGTGRVYTSHVCFLCLRPSKNMYIYNNAISARVQLEHTHTHTHRGENIWHILSVWNTVLSIHTRWMVVSLSHITLFIHNIQMYIVQQHVCVCARSRRARRNDRIDTFA